MRKAPLASVTTNARKNRKTRLEKSDHKTTTRRTFSTLKDDAFTGTFATTLFVCDFCIRIVGATTFAEEATAYMMMMMMMFLFLTCVCDSDGLERGAKGSGLSFFFFVRCSSKACGLISLHRLLKFGLHECVFRLSSTKGCTNTLNSTTHRGEGKQKIRTLSSSEFIHHRVPLVSRAQTHTHKNTNALCQERL